MMDQYRLQRFGDGGPDEDESRRTKPKISEAAASSLKQIEADYKSRVGDTQESKKKVDIRDYLEDDRKRQILEKTKEIYVKRLPKAREDILAYQLNWAALFGKEAVEKVGRPWIGKKIKDYMGVEEQSVVGLIVKLLGARPTPQAMKEKLAHILDEKTDEFVVKLWQTLIFEDMKIEEGLYS